MDMTWGKGICSILVIQYLVMQQVNMGIQFLIICFIFMSLTVSSTTLTCFALIWFLNFSLGAPLFKVTSQYNVYN